MEISNIISQSKIYLERDCRKHIKDYINVNRKIIIISDDNVPYLYIEDIKRQCPHAYVHMVEHGEKAKCLRNVEIICKELHFNNFEKDDMIFAVGGGVIGDLSGYIAAVYKMGISFVSLPTTTLSQIDSSIGGKTAVNLGNVKNIIGAFYHPSVVLIDVNTLVTLPREQYYAGLVEAIKTGLILDKKLFEMFERNEIDFQEKLVPEDLEKIIKRSLIVKRDIVAIDEKEQGVRKILNFGHTFGHAIESIHHLRDYSHGECVGIGMMMVLHDDEIRHRLKRILKQMKLPFEATYNKQELINYVSKDKKVENDTISLVLVDEIGKGYIKEIPFSKLDLYIRGGSI